MQWNRINTFGSLILVTNFVTGASQPTWAQDAKTRDPNMAPLEQYLMAHRNAEIALARSAAPAAISRDAEVLIPGKVVTRRLSKERTASCVWWSGLGGPILTIQNFGIPEFGVRSVTTRQPLDPSCLQERRG
jgi:hypothetical protein